MPTTWMHLEADLAAGASCPVADCGALAVTDESIARIDEIRRTCSFDWEFVCPRCGNKFWAAGDELLFQAIPKGWLQAGLSHAPA